MNRVILTGRLTGDPTVNVNGENKFARYTLAVDRRIKRDPDNPNQQTADFVSCVTFGKGADFVDQYLRKGMKIAISGRIQTGRYQNKDGQTIYTTDVVVEEHEFCESKSSREGQGQRDQDPLASAKPATPAATPTATPKQNATHTEPFINIPDNIDMEVPFT